MTTLSPEHAAASEAAIREMCSRLADAMIAMDRGNHIDAPTFSQARAYASDARRVMAEARRIYCDAQEHIKIAEQYEDEASAAGRY